MIIQINEPDAMAVRLLDKYGTGSNKCKEQNFYTKTQYLGYNIYLNHMTYEIIASDEDADSKLLNEYLREHYYIVNFDLNTHKEEFRQTILNRTLEKSLNEENIPLAVMLQPTLDCNAHCPYCFENKYRTKQKMSDETALKVVDYIINRAVNNMVDISLFGGEPLYYTRPQNIIVDELADRGVYYTTRLTTNGYYLDKISKYDLVHRWHTVTIQVSLDGDEPLYSNTKQYDEEKENALEHVINNIKLVLSYNANIKFFIRLNVSTQNENSIKALIDRYKDVFNAGEFITVYASEVVVDDVVQNRANAVASIRIMNYLLDNNVRTLSTVSVRHSIHGCAYTDGNWSMITPDGTIVPCPEGYDTDEFRLGHIDNPSEFNLKQTTVTKTLLHSLNKEYCDNCPLYFSCHYHTRCNRMRQPNHNWCKQCKDRVEFSLKLALWRYFHG